MKGKKYININIYIAKCINVSLKKKKSYTELSKMFTL